MFGYRTPVTTKRTPTGSPVTQHSPNKNEKTEMAGPSQLNKTITKSVADIVEKINKGEGETGVTEIQNLVDLSSPPKKPVPANISGSKEKQVKPIKDKILASPTTISKGPVNSSKKKYENRLVEAKACLTKAKLHLGNSRNLKTDIKLEVTQAIERLYQLVKEAEDAKNGQVNTPTIKQNKSEESNRLETIIPEATPQTVLMNKLIENMKEHSELITECKKHTLALTDHIKSFPNAIDTPKQNVTYAQAASNSKQAVQVHSLVISSEGDDSSGEVVEKIRMAVDAKAEGIMVERIRKAKDQKVIVGCRSQEDLAKVAGRIKESGINLKIEEVKNKDPLVILRDVLTYNTDDDIVAALRNQNKHLLEDISVEDQRLTIKYRRKKRNPHVNDVIMQVSPQVWQRLTAAERAHIDLQRVRVEDKSPLVQCSLCLGYGHGRRFCKVVTTERCSHCGGPHMWTECADRLAGEAPNCCNCTKAEKTKTDHNAFSQECPVRKKWDALARAATAYC